MDTACRLIGQSNPGMHGLVQHLVSLASHLGTWGYLIVFLIVVLECQPVLGLFIPGESLVLVTGFVAGQGVFGIEALIIAVAAGAIVGDSIGYELGRHLGRPWLLRHGGRVGVGPERLQKVEAFMHRHGGKSVFAAHFMHVLRALMPFTAGANRMPYRRFLPFNAAGCVLWAVVFSLAGYLLGGSWQIIKKWMGRVAALAGLVVALALVLAWLWSWLVRHELELKARWRAFAATPRMTALRRRFARELDFLERRLTPGGYLGLHVTVGAIVFILAAWWFGGVVEDLVTREPLIGFDHRLAVWFHRHATPTATAIASELTALGSYVVAISAVAMAVWFGFRRAWHQLAAVVLTVGGGALLNFGVKELFHRQRPAFAHAAAHFQTFSFPSGHTVSATLFYGLVAIFVMRSRLAWRWRLLAPLVAFFLVLLVGLTRLYLEAHYLSDVLAAMALGMMWLSFSVTAIEIDRRYRAQFRHEGP